ncbi:unnamed protein product [Arabidopsis thaliana]|uniref:Uncharacterized protein n=2 Tax=Arabidopsis thaliana TaxID=3702 RepID=A0A5S9WLA6_ARATH|nr:unnamed protein product [Arabidopsis thaliana]
MSFNILMTDKYSRVSVIISEDSSDRVSKFEKKLSISMQFSPYKAQIQRIKGIRWHSTGTYDCQSRTGGPFRTMRFDAEQVNGANYGIQIALRLLDPIRFLKSSNLLTVLWPLKLLVALKFISTLEERLIIPESVCSAFFVDMDKPHTPPEGRLPDATKGFDLLRDVFAKRMGLSDKDIVALSGSHTPISPSQS